MRKNRISEFLESIDSEKWNCVYQANGMTLLTTKEYNYRYDERVNLQSQLKKQKEVIDKVYELIKQHIRKDGFLELNEWQTRDLLDILNDVSEWK